MLRVVDMPHSRGTPYAGSSIAIFQRMPPPEHTLYSAPGTKLPCWHK